MRTAKVALAMLTISLALVITVSVEAQVTQKKTAPNLKVGLMNATKEKEKTVDKILNGLGPALREQITAGKQVVIPGLGTFRVVQIEAHKDLINGRPAVVPAKSYVEFVPDGALDAAANSPTAVPARTVPPAEFRINPYTNPGQKTENTRSGRNRLP